MAQKITEVVLSGTSVISKSDWFRILLKKKMGRHTLLERVHMMSIKASSSVPAPWNHEIKNNQSKVINELCRA